MKVEVEVLDVLDKQLKSIEFEGIRYTLVEYEEPTQPITKPYKKKSKGKYWDKTYMKELSKDEIDTVKQAILHVGTDYIPTTKAIADQTGFEIRDVQTILHKMRELDIITSERTKGHKVIYRLKSDTEYQMD